MSKIIDRRQALTLLGLGLAAGVTGLAPAAAATARKQTYSSGEIIDAGQDTAAANFGRDTTKKP